MSASYLSFLDLFLSSTKSSILLLFIFLPVTRQHMEMVTTISYWGAGGTDKIVTCMAYKLHGMDSRKQFVNAASLAAAFSFY